MYKVKVIYQDYTDKYFFPETLRDLINLTKSLERDYFCFEYLVYLKDDIFGHVEIKPLPLITRKKWVKTPNHSETNRFHFGHKSV